jgi:hypothetical protein
MYLVGFEVALELGNILARYSDVILGDFGKHPVMPLETSLRIIIEALEELRVVLNRYNFLIADEKLIALFSQINVFFCFAPLPFLALCGCIYIVTIY